MILAGGLILLGAAAAGRTRWIREAYLDSLRKASVAPSLWTSGDVQRVRQSVRTGDLKAALARVMEVLARPGLPEIDRQAAVLLGTRLRIQLGRGAVEELLPYLALEVHEDLWALALDESVLLRKAMGDVAGAVDLLESAAGGRLRHPGRDRIPFPYIQNWAAEALTEHYLSVGDGPRAYAWAHRLKHEFAVDYDSVCGNPIVGEHNQIEQFLESGAKLSGFTYLQQPMDWALRNRRIYGPYWLEIAVAIAGGVLIAFAGVCILTRRAGRWPGRVVSWRLFWKRRGGGAQVWIAALVVVAGAAQVWLLLTSCENGFPLRPDTLLWMSLLSPTYLVPLVALIGCRLAAPEPASDGRRREGRSTPPRLSRPRPA